MPDQGERTRGGAPAAAAAACATRPSSALIPRPQDMEAAVLPTLLHAAGTQTAKSSPFSRSHCVRLAAQACTPQACTAWRAMLEQPLLGKLLGLLVRALRDAHAAVRSAAVEGLGVVAAQLAAACPESLTGDISNPVLSCILAALGEPGGDVQQAVGGVHQGGGTRARRLLAPLHRPPSAHAHAGRCRLCPG